MQVVAVLLTANVKSSIRKPPPGWMFELKINIVHQLHTNGQFTSLPNEDPQLHITNFMEATDTYIRLEVSSEYVILTLFLYSLLGSAK